MIREHGMSSNDFLALMEMLNDNCAYYELAEDGETFKCQ